jgi:hypothetical protein
MGALAKVGLEKRGVEGRRKVFLTAPDETRPQLQGFEF